MISLEIFNKKKGNYWCMHCVGKEKKRREQKQVKDLLRSDTKRKLALKVQNSGN